MRAGSRDLITKVIKLRNLLKASQQDLRKNPSYGRAVAVQKDKRKLNEAISGLRTTFVIVDEHP